jgi:hypothetical protein
LLDSDQKSDIAFLKQKIEELEKQVQQPTTINNYNNCTINTQQNNVQQNNVTITDFGNENLEYISDKFIRQCLKRLSSGFEDLTKKIHFNPEKPEYQNITVSNKKDTFLEVFKDGKWHYQDKNSTLDALIKQCFDVLSSHYDEYEDEIRKEMSSMRFKQVDQFVDNVLNKDKTTQSTLRKCLYLLILNNRDMINKPIEKVTA